MLFLILALLLQEVQKVPRADKLPYLEAVRTYGEAQALLASDPERALGRFDEILRDPKIRKTECILVIEDRPGDSLPPCEFFPYQCRGRALLALANGKEDVLARAVADLERSVELGVGGSRPYLETARSELKKLRVSIPPAPAVREVPPGVRSSWERMLAEGKYRSALALLEGEEKSGPSPALRDLTQETLKREKAWIQKLDEEFRTKLGELGTLSGLGEEEIRAAFALPDPGECLSSSPLLGWRRTTLPRFLAARSGKEPGATLLRAAREAQLLGEGDAALATERTGYDLARTVVEDAAQKAALAPRAERERLQARAASQWVAWKALSADPVLARSPAPVAQHTRELGALMEGFPADLEELDHLDLAACLLDVDPRLALRRAERELAELDGRAARSTIESRRRFYSMKVEAQSLRIFLEGGSAQEAISQAKVFADALGASGGPLDPDRFGPRVRRVFDALR